MIKGKISCLLLIVLCFVPILSVSAEACFSNLECGFGNYCAKAKGDCNGIGVCQKKPDVCSLFYAPVCGCDGQTYTNSGCAAVAGVNVADNWVCGCNDSDQDGFFAQGGLCGPIDCNDNDPTVNPAAAEICTDGIDNDCDGLIDNQDPNAVNCPPTCTDADGDGYAAEGGVCGPVDCNDTDPSINPGAGEICVNAIDDDCDGLVDMTDPNCQIPCLFNEDCFAPTSYCQKDWGACEGAGVCMKSPELCTNLWMPVCGCDGKTYSNECFAARAGINVDHGGECIPPCPDNDGDGYAVCTTACDSSGKTCGDCNDNNASINPYALEICDGVDNNCDARVDEGFDKDGDGYTVCRGDCNDSNSLVNPGAIENCKDSIDNDCDGLIDNKDSDCRKKK